MAVDKYPQFMRLSRATEAVAGTAVETETQTPVRRSESLVMEILMAEFEFSGGGCGDTDADVAIEEKASITTRTSGSTPAVARLNDSSLISLAKIRYNVEYGEATETGGGGWSENRITRNDYSSSGYGFLCAANSLFLQVDGSTSCEGVLAADARILYRLVKVTANELVGLVEQYS